MNWTRRVQGPPGPPQELYQVRAAARDLAEQAKHAPAGTGPVFQKIAQTAFLGTAVLSGALALIHLAKAIIHWHPAPSAEHPPEHEGREQHARPHQEHHHTHHGHHGRG